MELKKKYIPISLILLLFSPAFAYTDIVSVYYDGNYTSLCGSGMKTCNYSDLNGNILIDAIGNTSFIRPFGLYNDNGSFPDSDLWINLEMDYPFVDLEVVNYDLNIRDLNVLDSRLAFQLISSRDNAFSYLEFGRYGNAEQRLNLTELGVGQHNINITNFTSCWSYEYFYDNDTDVLLEYPICPNDLFIGKPINHIWLFPAGMGNGVDDWNINITVGNLTVYTSDYPPYTIGDQICNGGTENSTNSPDCAISVPNMSYLYDNLELYDSNYIKMNLVNVEGDGFLDWSSINVIRGLGTTYNNGSAFAYKFKDSSSTLLMFGFLNGYGEVVLSNGNRLDSFAGQLIEVTGMFHRTTDYIPYDLYLDVWNITVLGNADISYYSYDTYEGFVDEFTVEPSTLRYTYSKETLNEIITFYQMYRFNETHIYRNIPVYLGSELGIEDLKLIDEQYINVTGNFSAIFLGFNSEHTDYEFGMVIEGDTIPDYLNTTKYGSQTIIFKGNFYNQTFDEIDYFTQVWIFEGTEKHYAIIGDGVCGSLESYVPTDWNYEPECELDRYGSTTGYFIASSGAGLMAFIIGIFLLAVVTTMFAVDDSATRIKIFLMILFLMAISVVAFGLIAGW